MILPATFYKHDAAHVARAVLGSILCHDDHGTLRLGRIVEAEAYLGVEDLACHASKGRTKRTEVMFGPAGYSYVYLIYGMYDMFNVVTEGDGHAVLIRALEPLSNTRHQTDGPGKLTRALNLTREHGGLDLMMGERVWLERGFPPKTISTSARIGMTEATGIWRDKPLRFFDEDSAWVSRRSKRRAKS